MAWVEFTDRVPINTQAIEFVSSRGGKAYISLGGRAIYISGITIEEIEERIAKAERAERRTIFEENKDEIVEAVASRLEEKMTAKIEQMMDGLADRLIEKAHLQKPSVAADKRRVIPKAAKP